MNNLHDQKIAVELSTGASIPLRGVKSVKTDNVYHAILKRKLDGSFYNPRKYGVKVDKTVIGGALPKSVKVSGSTVSAVEGKTMSGNRKVTFNAPVKVDGQDRVLHLSISALPNGDFNVSGSLHRPGGASGRAVTAL